LSRFGLPNFLMGINSKPRIARVFKFSIVNKIQLA
jgi:hypothetical protein